MNDIQTIMNNTMEEKFNDGTIKNMVSDQLDKFIKDTISSCLDSWSEPSKALKEKIQGTMLNVIEKHDFSDYLTKFDTVIIECLKSSVIAENKQLMENLKVLFKEDNTEKEITIHKMFEKYKEFIEEHFEANDDDEIEWDTDDGECTAYVEARCNIEKQKTTWAISRDESYDVIFSCENMEQKFKIRVHKYDFQKQFNISFDHNLELSSIRFADEFTLYLLNLDQRGVKIDSCSEDYLEYEVLVTKEGEY